ncbi:MAG: hypothetical protein IMW93_02400 [Thermoanaerobacteraceae bacterium]|nr:hypothetical protein [Thermoanaerobacteraceae bacterium]
MDERRMGVEQDRFQELVLQQLQSLAEGQKNIQEDVTALKGDVSALKEGVSVLKEDVSVLKEDVSVLKEDVSVLKEDVVVLKQDVSTLQQDVAGLQKDMGNLHAKVDKLDLRVTDLEMRLETDVIERVRVLFDAHSVHMDYFQSIRDSQARIEEGVEVLRRRSVEHEFRFKDYERELRLLRAERK